MEARRLAGDRGDADEATEERSRVTTAERVWEELWVGCMKEHLDRTRQDLGGFAEPRTKGIVMVCRGATPGLRRAGLSTLSQRLRSRRARMWGPGEEDELGLLC